MKLLHRSGVCVLALVAGAAALQFEPAVVRDIVVKEGGFQLAVEAIRVPLWSAAYAQSADSFSLENVRFTVGSATYEAKRIEFSGVTSSRADIDSLFAPASTEPMASRLAKVSAKQVLIPEIRMSQKLGNETQTATYKNITLNDIVQGKIASLAVETAGVEATSPKGTVVFSYGRTSASEMDLAAFARMYETKAESASAPLTRIQGAFSIENVELVDPNEGTTIKIARMNGRDFLARPTKDSWTGTAALIEEIGEKKDPSSQEQSRAMAAAADLLTAFDIGLIEATGIDITATQKDEKDPAKPASSSTARISRLAYTGSAGGQPTDIRMEGLDAGDQDNRVKIGTLSLTGFSILPTLEGLKNLEGKSFKDFDTSTLRSLAPTIGTLRISGVDLQSTSKEDETSKPVPISLSLKDFELTADKPINAVPTNIRLGLNNLAMALPADSDDEGLKELMALGYKAIDLSFLMAADWNESASEITLKEVSLQSQDMANIALTGLIGNVSKDLFSTDQATAASALLGAKAKAANVVVEDKGLLERHLAKTAKEQKTKPESLRQLYASAAPMVISSFLGNSEQAISLGQAISRFIKGPGKLTIDAQPKNSSGFGVLDAMLNPDPKQVLEKLNVTAKVE